MSRRDFIALMSTVSAAALASNGCKKRDSITSSATSQPSADGSNQPVQIGYLPITDAAALLVAHHQKLYEAEGLNVEPPRLFRSWAQIVEAFLARQVNVIHLLMPATLWVRYGSKAPAKVVAWNHTNGSAITVRPEINQVQDLAGKTVAVPFWYSIHNVVLQQLLQQAGLEPVVRSKVGETASGKQVNLVVLPPSDMVSALASGGIAGYIVAEPFNAASENLKTGRILRFTGDVWKDHACCVVFMHEDDVVQRPQWTQRVVNAIVRAQSWMRTNRPEVANILSKDGGKYTPHPLAVLQRALSYNDASFYGAHGDTSPAIIHPEWNANRIDFQPYPFPSFTEQLVRSLQTTQIGGDRSFLSSLTPETVASDLVDASFVKNALSLVGGPSAFGLDGSLTRQEIIRI